MDDPAGNGKLTVDLGLFGLDLVGFVPSGIRSGV
jgi:hypothetical protein